MEHSKVKLEVGLKDCEDSIFVSHPHGPCAGTELFAMCYGDNQNSRAACFVARWNEHDTLKAQVELFDDVIANALKAVRSMLSNKLEPDKILCIGERLEFRLMNPELTPKVKEIGE